MILEYTIKQALTELNISKATLYYRINKFKSKMEPHILIKNGKKFISHEGMKILKANDGLDSLPDSSDNGSDCSENEKQVNNDVFNVLKMENEFLKSQIKEKTIKFRCYPDL